MEPMGHLSILSESSRTHSPPFSEKLPALHSPALQGHVQGLNQG